MIFPIMECLTSPKTVREGVRTEWKQGEGGRIKLEARRGYSQFGKERFDFEDLKGFEN